MVAVRQVRPFALGKTFATPAALAAMRDAGQEPSEFLRRHGRGDWGEADAEDTEMNDFAADAGDMRIFSAYLTARGIRIWVVTEADRSVTTVLLPDEY